LHAAHRLVLPGPWRRIPSRSFHRDELRAVEEGCGIDLAAVNGDPNSTLTMPVRYAATPGGTIEYADISFDYTRRGDPSELIPVRAQLAAN
jgi:hypothetical protein